LEVVKMNSSVEETVQKVVDAINRHDLEACVACYSPDAELQDPGFPDPVHGIEHVREGFTYWFSAFPDVHVQVVRTIIQGPEVALEWLAEASHVGEYVGVQGHGQRLRYLAAIHFRIENGLITRDLSLFDATSLRVLESNAAAG
jgi:steroid delta-isomerase-like uncharacterized protein